MIGLCLAVATSIVASLPVDQFTLRWMHSIERVEWEEDWRIDAPARELVLVESRVRGSGAGMEPPEDAVFRDGVWRAPGRLRVPMLRLAASGYTDDWQLCANGRCEALLQRVGKRDLPGRGANVAPGHPITLLPCRRPARDG